MANIKGIGVELFIDIPQAAGSDDPDTIDPIYLGVYGKKCGREFSLTYLTKLPEFAPHQSVMGNLGTLCHFQANMNPHQIPNSTAGGHLDPAVDKIDLDSVSFVYLKKLVRPNVSADDLLRLSLADVYLCDGVKIRYFTKGTPMIFAHECGLKYWLEESEICDPNDDPNNGNGEKKCRVKVTLKSIEYLSSGAKVGDKIRYNTDISGTKSSGYDGDFDRGETITPNTILYNKIVGKCPGAFTLPLEAEILDQGPVKNRGSKSLTLNGKCPGKYNRTLTVSVKKFGQNKYGKFRHTYSISAVCE